MKKVRLIILFLLLLSLTVRSQESILSKEIAFVKAEAFSQNFQSPQEDTLQLSRQSHFVLPENSFEKGFIYYWVVFVDGCADCPFKLRYRNSSSSDYYPLDATLKSSDSLQRIEYTFQKMDDENINLEAFLEANSDAILYSLLFKKENQD